MGLLNVYIQNDKYEIQEIKNIVIDEFMEILNDYCYNNNGMIIGIKNNDSFFEISRNNNSFNIRLHNKKQNQEKWIDNILYNEICDDLNNYLKYDIDFFFKKHESNKKININIDVYIIIIAIVGLLSVLMGFLLDCLNLMKDYIIYIWIFGAIILIPSLFYLRIKYIKNMFNK